FGTRALFVEISAHAGKRSAGANRSNERVNFAIGLFPDLRSSAAIMRIAISGIIELVRPEPATLLREPTRDMIVIFRVLVRFLRNGFYFSAKRTEQVHFLWRLIIWNHN